MLLKEAFSRTTGLRAQRSAMSMHEIDTRLDFLRHNAIEKSTGDNYRTGLRDYTMFCLRHNLSLDPTVDTLSRYISYTSAHIASGPKYLTGARHFLAQFYPEFDANRAHVLVRKTIAGSRKLRADPIRRKLPLRTSHLTSFINIARSTCSYDDLLFATVMSCCFYGCHRSGELVWSSSLHLQDMRKVVKRCTLTFSENRAGYHLPYHKTDRFYRGTEILLTSQTVANPVAMLKDYVSLRDRFVPSSAALFVRSDGSLPTRAWFESKLFAVVNRDFGGHSARAGGATFYANLGVSVDVIQAIGRWSSEAWKIYIRENPSIRAEIELARLRHV